MSNVISLPRGGGVNAILNGHGGLTPPNTLVISLFCASYLPLTQCESPHISILVSRPFFEARIIRKTQQWCDHNDIFSTEALEVNNTVISCLERLAFDYNKISEY